PFYSAGTGRQNWRGSGKILKIRSPVDGNILGEINLIGEEEYKTVMAGAKKAFPVWKAIPAPRRGDIVRQFGDALRTEKGNLGKLVSYEMGKSLQEGLGEVQEMIDICDFAVG